MEKQTYKTTKEHLINTIIPVESRTYKPFSHENVINLTLEAIDKSGFKLGNESYTSARDNNIAVGKYTIRDVADSEMELQISWLNSYNKSKRLTWGIGSQVRICMNGMISADLGAFKKKHQGDIEDYSPKAISEYVKRASDVFKEMQREREKMKEIQVDTTITAHILGEMFLNEEFIASTQLNIIKREISNPSYDYKSENSLWSLYNHCTLSLKELHPSLWMKAHMDTHRYFVDKSGILIPSSPIISDISPNQLTLPLEQE